MNRPRGRPKQYDEETALEAAGYVFWTKGFNATSLDDLSDAMAMNRPSIYRAFGDKEAIYRKALGQFIALMEEAMEQTLFTEDDLQKAFTNFYRQALGIYTSGPQAKGCLVMSTAVPAATSHPEIQADLMGVIRTIDEKMQTRLQQAAKTGQLPLVRNAKTRAMVAQGVLHSLSIRARAGESKTELELMIIEGVEMIVS